jgi:predicted transcriptional regulator
MSNKTVQQPTDSELEILRILWEKGPSTVRFVNEQLNRTRRVGYTTTLKIMQIMTDKKLVIRNEDERSHIYSAAFEEKDIQNRLIDKIVDAAFGGSASRLVMQVLGNHKASQEELEEIRKLLNNLDENGKQ